MKVAIAVVVAVLVAVGAWFVFRDADKARVIAHLKANLDDPTVEVVRWWPPVNINSVIDDEISKEQAQITESKKLLQSLRDNQATDADMSPLRDIVIQREVRVESLQKIRGTPICALRYRTKQAGSLVLEMDFFSITETSVTNLSQSVCGTAFYSVFTD